MNMTIPLPDNEQARLVALRQYQILDTEPEPVFEKLAGLASQICGTPIACISFLDESRQWFKSHLGLEVREIPREVAFCTYTILQSDPLVIADALEDDRFATNPLVTGQSKIRFYAGVPLINPQGFALGTLSLMDQVPQALTPEQLHALQVLGQEVMAQLELRHQLTVVQQLTAEHKQVQEQLEGQTQRPPQGGAQAAQLFADVALKIHQSLNLDEILNTTVSEVRRFLGADRAFIYQFEPDWSGTVAVESVDSRWPSILGVTIKDSFFNTRIGQNLYRQERMQITADIYDAGLSECHINLLAQLQIRANLVVPILCQQQLWGLLVVNHCSEPRPWQSWEVELLRRLSTQVAIALQQADLYHQAQTELGERQRAEAVLRQVAAENLQLAQAVASASEGVVITDPNQPNNPIIYVNPTFSRITQYPAEEVLGRNCRLLQGPDSNPAMLTQIRQGLSEQREINVTLLNYRKDGQPFWNELKIAPVFSDRHDLLYFVGFQTDVSERIQAQEALRTSEEKYRNLVEQTHDWVWEIDPQGMFTYVSPQVKTILGYEPAEVWGKSIYEFMDSTQASRFAPVLEAFMGNHQPFSRLEKTLIHKAGHSVILETSGSPIFDSQSEFQGYRGIVRDITERRRAEQKIREQAALLDVATDAILVRDLEQRILFWNKGAERLYGWSAAEVLHQNANDLLYRETTPQLQEIQQQLLEQGEWQGELRQLTQSGEEVIVESRWSLVHHYSGNDQAILVVNTDITAKKQLESQFLRAQRMESIGTLASGIAHDLNNVLAPILMAVQLLEKKYPAPQAQQLLTMLKTNTHRGAELIKQVLSFARGQEGKRSILQIRHLIVEIVEIAQETFPRSIEIEANLPNHLSTLRGDPTQLHQVLMNLCVNARDAMPAGGRLKISVENRLIDEQHARLNLEAKPGPYVMITIADTGSGIPPEFLDRVFEPFFTTKEIGKGTGLGLSTVQGIVKGHGGFITVTSKVGAGTQFQVYLPAILTAETHHKKIEEPPQGQGETILVVDDEAACRQVIQASLEAHHYQVLTAADGIEAIALYRQHQQHIALVLTDMMMPSLDGPMTIRALHKMNPAIKIVAASGLIMGNQATVPSGCGVRSFLAKPYSTEDLLNTLAKVLQEPEGTSY